MFKNVASQQIVLLAIDTATNTPKTGDAANITAYLSKDYGTVTVLGDTTATEMDATNAPGLYKFDVTQTESNCDVAVFSGKSSTSGIRIVPVTVFMRPANFTAFSLNSSGQVLLQSGTGTGQLDFTSGVVKGNLTQVSGSAVNTSSAQLGVNVVNAGGTAWGSGAITRSAFSADSGMQTARSGTAQAGASGSITLDASASATTDFYKGSVVYLTGGTGANQAGRLITAYNGTTKVATITPAWATNPDATSTFAVMESGSVNLVAVGGTAGTTIPTVTTVTNQLTAAQIATGVWRDTTAGDFTVASSIGKSLYTSGNAPGAASGIALVGSNMGTITGGTITTYTGNTPQTGDAYARLGAPANASISADVAAVKTDTGNLVTRITSTLFSGITQLSKWLGALAGKTADASTLTEINSTTAGATYNNTTDSLEALRDHGDSSWITATSVTVSDKTGFKLASDGLALVTSWTTNITGSLSGNVGGIATGGIVAGSFALDSITSTALAASAVSEIQSGLMLASSYTAPLDATGIRNAVGLASANLDTQLDAIPTAVENSTQFQADLMAYEVEPGVLFIGAIRLGIAADSGITAKSGNTFTLRNAADTKDRITATVDDAGLRSAVTRDLT